MERGNAPVPRARVRARARAAGLMVAALTVLPALSVLTTGCNGTSSGAPPGLELFSFLSRRRASPRDLGESLDELAPVGPGTDVSQPAPFVERRLGPGNRSTSHILWPLLSVTRSREERSFALRPILAAESRPGEKRAEALWPIFSYRREGENRTFLARPLFLYKRRVRVEGSGREVDTDWFLFPLLFGGRDTREGSYFAVFPLFGTLKGQLGKEKLSFFLFPLWLAGRDKRYDSFHFMFPIMAYWKGPENFGRRLFPFFGVNKREGHYDRRFWLWPFFARWKTGLDTFYPADTFIFFPFYGRVKSRNIRDPDNPKPHLDWRFYMWPLYSFRKYAFRNKTEAHVPWPIFGHERADGLVVRKLWPIWGVRKSNDRRDKFVLWPFYRRTLLHEQYRESRWHNVAFIFSTYLDRWVEDEKGNRYPPPWPEDFGKIPDPRIEAGTHKPYPTREGEIRSRRYTQLWPLFRYKRNELGEMSLQMLSVIPHRSGGRAETLWGPFFSFYRCERDRTRQQRESYLFGLFRHFKRSEKAGPGMRYVNLAGVVNYHRRTGGGKRFSILGGLYGYERVGGRRAYRFLWVRFGRIPRAVREKHEGAYAAEPESR